MKRHSKAVILLAITSIILPLSLSASSSYGIAETETNRHPDPLNILSGRTKRSVPKARSTIKQVLKNIKKLKQNAKQTTRTKKNTQLRNPLLRNYRVDRSQRKKLYLTFDDGPLNGTGNVIRVLREEGVDATMFFIGKHINKRRTLYRRAISMPNLLIANHTYSHANGRYAHFYSDVTRVVNDINRAQAIIGGVKYLRLAGRNVWRMPQVNRDDYALSNHRRSIEHAKYEALVNRGYQIFGWDIEWNFDPATGRPTYGADHMAGRIERLYNSGRIAKSGKVVLLAHDYMFRGQSGIYKLRTLIQILRSNGWEFATIDDYSSTTPDTYMGKTHKRSGNPFDSFRTEWKIELDQMIAGNFVAKGLKQYLASLQVIKNKPTSQPEVIQLVLTKKEVLPTERKSLTVQQ